MQEVDDSSRRTKAVQKFYDRLASVKWMQLPMSLKYWNKHGCATGKMRSYVYILHFTYL